MLDKELCEIFGIDEFMQYLINEIDELEEYLSKKENLFSKYEIGRYQQLYRVREEYYKFLKKNKRK